MLRLEGKEQVQIVCMDLAVAYRSMVGKHFPRAVIVADRFHVIRLIHHHFLACWRAIDPVGSKNRGLMSLMRRHRHNGFHNKMESISRQAYGFRNFENYRQRVQVLCA